MELEAAKRKEEEMKKMTESQLLQQRERVPTSSGWFGNLFSKEASKKDIDHKHSPQHNPYNSGYTAASTVNNNPGRPQTPTTASSESDHSHQQSQYSNTNNLSKVPYQVTSKEQSQRSENEVFQMELICELLKSYFKIVKKTIKDRVPKSIMYFLVNQSKEDIQNILVQELYKEDLLESLLQESDDVAQRRDQYHQTIEILTSAQRILNEIIDFKL